MEKITRDSGFQCSSYKDKCLRRRIAVRIRARGASGCAEYSDMLDNDPREYERLVRSLTVNVTKFFRNWETYSAIDQKVVPSLMARDDREVRVWSAGCSSGEEPYSLSILMHRHATANAGRSLESISIVGTDIDTDCLGEADRAVYTESALGDTPADLREHYFPRVAGSYTMLPEVRRLVRFELRDLLQFQPPFDDAHLIVCRNVIIYLERAAQDALFAHFHKTLAPGGFLVLGKVETLLGEARGLFSPVNARERIFRKI
ncbi:MAG: methyltransferase, CheR-type, SAM-binding domain, C-terminal [Gemmatimonadales bacterium]|nr:methyltransferase, CheR-type, SAM-binding domain, C-terminal [Gemmatimonadales bacterium]